MAVALKKQRKQLEIAMLQVIHQVVKIQKPTSKSWSNATDETPTLTSSVIVAKFAAACKQVRDKEASTSRWESEGGSLKG